MKPAPKTQWQHYKSVATWIPMDVFEKLQEIADSNKVSVSAYIKAIIVDAVEEESLLVKSKATISTRIQIV